jgi:hypothetical protein
MKRIGLCGMLVLGTLSLSACGYSTGDRALSGAALGAAGGAGVGALVGGVSPVEGAVIGGALGAATGAITNPNVVNAGRPVWR